MTYALYTATLTSQLKSSNVKVEFWDVHFSFSVSHDRNRPLSNNLPEVPEKIYISWKNEEITSIEIPIFS
jgi:hypothetical protein